MTGTQHVYDLCNTLREINLCNTLPGNHLEVNLPVGKTLRAALKDVIEWIPEAVTQKGIDEPRRNAFRSGKKADVERRLCEIEKFVASGIQIQGYEKAVCERSIQVR